MRALKAQSYCSCWNSHDKMPTFIPLPEDKPPQRRGVYLECTSKFAGTDPHGPTLRQSGSGKGDGIWLTQLLPVLSLSICPSQFRHSIRLPFCPSFTNPISPIHPSFQPWYVLQEPLMCVRKALAFLLVPLQHLTLCTTGIIFTTAVRA